MDWEANETLRGNSYMSFPSTIKKRGGIWIEIYIEGEGLTDLIIINQ